MHITLYQEWQLMKKTKYPKYLQNSQAKFIELLLKWNYSEPKVKPLLYNQITTDNHSYLWNTKKRTLTFLLTKRVVVLNPIISVAWKQILIRFLYVSYKTWFLFIEFTLCINTLTCNSSPPLSVPSLKKNGEKKRCLVMQILDSPLLRAKCYTLMEGTLYVKFKRRRILCFTT